MTTLARLFPMATLGALGSCRRGVSMIEFALIAPIFITLGLTGMELSNYLLSIWRVNEIALETADNASRVGVDTGLSNQQLREVDINDALTAARLQGQRINFVEHGRLTISSLEDPSTQKNPKGVQWVHWQRCIGTNMASNYKSANSAGDGGDTGKKINGMGTASPQVQAPLNSGVMFVEANYEYQPLVLSTFIGTQRIHFEQAFIVRDKRDFSGTGLTNPSNDVVHTCDQAWSS